MWEMPEINLFSGVAVFVQIENHVKFAISAGLLSPGDRLPAVRELAQKLKLNPNTIARSYRDLEVMGYVYARRGMGVFVSPGASQKCRDEVRREIVARIHQALAEAKAAGMSDKALTAVTRKCLDTEAAPYEEAPRQVLAMARTKG